MNPTRGSTNQRPLVVAVVVLSIVRVVLLIALIVVSTSDNGTNENVEKRNSCSATVPLIRESDVDSASPSVFQNLTMAELVGLKKYMYETCKHNANSVFLAELHLPMKYQVLQHLDRDSPQPKGMTCVVTTRGEMPNQEIQELVVGPLPSPTYHRAMPGINSPLSYLYRPMTEEDYGVVTDVLKTKYILSLEIFC